MRHVLINNKINDICVIGSGPTGVELCSTLNIKYNSLKNSQFTQINLVEAMNNILSSFSEKTKDMIKQHLSKSNNIQIFLDTPVLKITQNHIMTNKYSIKSDLTIWTGGVKFNGYRQTSLYYTLDKLLSENNKITPRGINVNDNFTINLTNIYCLGDMVANKGPPTAQNAKLQAKWLANYFNKQMDKSLSPFVIPNANKTTKLLHLRDKIYIESPIYNGFMPEWMNIMIDHFF